MVSRGGRWHGRIPEYGSGHGRLYPIKLDWVSSFLAILSCSINTPIYLLILNATPT